MSTQTTSWTHRPTADGHRRVAKRRIADERRLLAEVPLFGDLPARQLKRLADLASTATFEAGHEIVKEGAAGSVFYVIAEGSAKVARSSGRTIAKLGPGEFFGELSILTGTPRMASVTATASPTVCVTLSSRALRAALEDEPKLALRILENVASRLMAAERPPAG
jgi:CRP-like cAMP-binding protein